jgi:hypothetical protein
MAEASGALLIVGLGVLGIVVLTALAFLRAQELQRIANKLVELALSGRADEARILARNATRDITSLLDALGGDLTAPKRPSPFRDLALVLPIATPAIALAFYCISKIHGGAEGRVAGASSTLVGFAILIPVSFAAAFAIIAIGRHSARLVRGSYVTLLARNVKTTLDAEVAEALRRGPAQRDPRGD